MSVFTDLTLNLETELIVLLQYQVVAFLNTHLCNANARKVDPQGGIKAA